MKKYKERKKKEKDGDTTRERKETRVKNESKKEVTFLFINA
jgi:hypothetical protein